jgi:hypothetical protein
MFRASAIVLLLCVAVPAASSVRNERTVRSAALAKQLGVALLEHKLDAIAARDPEAPDRFVAALFFPDSQMLVISASYSSPSLLDEKLAQKNYREVYLDLGTTQFADTSMFFQDMKADGLCHDRDQTADILYEGRTSTILDGDWKKHGLSEQAYEKRLADADDRYSRLLELLLAQIQAT